MFVSLAQMLYIETLEAFSRVFLENCSQVENVTLCNRIVDRKPS